MPLAITAAAERKRRWPVHARSAKPDRVRGYPMSLWHSPCVPPREFAEKDRFPSDKGVADMKRTFKAVLTAAGMVLASAYGASAALYLQALSTETQLAND